MINFVNQSAATFYLTLQENRDNVTGLTSAYTFIFKSDSNNYSAVTHIACTNYADTGHTEMRYNRFNYTPNFTYNGYYTYYVYDPVNSNLLEMGRMKILSGSTTEKTTYKESRPQKTIYRK